MGLFLSMGSVIGAKTSDVSAAVIAYTEAAKRDRPDNPQEHHLRGNITLCPGENGVTVVYGEDFYNWDEASEFLSRHLQAPVFSFHIHDDDFWMYQLYVNGVFHSKFNPLPKYFDDDEDVEPWRGDARIISRLVPGVTVNSIERYFVFCTDENSEEMAYPDDEFPRGDFWQICDFMNKLGLAGPFPGEDDEGFGKDFRIVKV